MSTSWTPPRKAHSRARYSPGLLHACIGGGSNCWTLQACQASLGSPRQAGYQQGMLALLVLQLIGDLVDHRGALV